MATSTITSKGQVTVPKSVRDAMKIGPGDKLVFVRMEDGNFAVMPASEPVLRLKGLLPKPDRAVSLAEMDDAIAQQAL